jgi:Family of unknown function (DUF6111)
MIRVLIENVLLFLLPAIVYFVFAYAGRRAGASGGHVLRDAPLPFLALLGLTLVITVMTLFSTIGGGKPGQDYRPAVFKDGKVEPGQMK